MVCLLKGSKQYEQLLFCRAAHISEVQFGFQILGCGLSFLRTYRMVTRKNWGGRDWVTMEGRCKQLMTYGKGVGIEFDSTVIGVAVLQMWWTLCWRKNLGHSTKSLLRLINIWRRWVSNWFGPICRSHATFLLSVQVFGLHAVECKKGTQQVYMIVNGLSSHSRDKVVAWWVQSRCLFLPGDILPVSVETKCKEACSDELGYRVWHTYSVSRGG